MWSVVSGETMVIGGEARRITGVRAVRPERPGKASKVGAIWWRVVGEVVGKEQRCTVAEFQAWLDDGNL